MKIVRLLDESNFGRYVKLRNWSFAEDRLILSSYQMVMGMKDDIYVIEGR